MGEPRDRPAGSILARNLASLMCLAAIFAVVCFLRYQTKSIADDAFITFTYSRNLVEGHGFVFNPGERVLGTSSPLYAFAMAIFILVGAKPWIVSLILDCFFLTGLIWIVVGLCRIAGEKSLPWLALAQLFFLDSLTLIPVGGMETGLFLFLVYSAFYTHLEKLFTLSAVLAVMASLTRPEGFLVIVAILLSLLVDPGAKDFRPHWKRWALAIAAPLGLCVLAVYLYYGSLIPQSVVAKRAQSGVPGFASTFWSAFIYNQFTPGGRFTVWGALEWIGLAVMWIRMPRLRLLVIWFLVYLGFMKFGNAPTFPWYFAPVHPVRAIALAALLVAVARELVRWGEKLVSVARGGIEIAGWDLKAHVVVPFAILVLVGADAGRAEYSMDMMQWVSVRQTDVLDWKGYERLGPWLKEHCGPSDEILALEVGYLRYFSEHPVFDAMGLVSPEAMRGGAGRDFWEMADGRKSRFVVVPYDRGARALPPAKYEKIYVPVRGWNCGYYVSVIFERAD